MPAKCNKVKNPCKICLESVSNKTGLQCQGACKKWVHFTCLNYTPGKIKDIKNGIIKVTCPCPDCRTAAPKEYRTDEPFSCTNIQCPSNLPRTCTSNTCPSNSTGCTPKPLLVCEKDTCKKHKSDACPAPPSPPPLSGPPAPVCPPAPLSSSCSSGSGEEYGHVRGDMGNRGSIQSGQAMNVVEQICTTVGQLSKQINSLMNEMKTLMGGQGGYQKPDSGGQTTKSNKPCNCPGNPRH